MEGRPSSQLELNLGPLLVFTFLTVILYGVLCAQCRLLLQRSGQTTRPPAVRLSIWMLWILTTVHMVLAIDVCYWYMVSKFGDLEAVMAIYPWSAGARFLVELLVNFVVQGYFLHRVWMLSKKNRLLVAVSGIFIILTIGFGLGLAGVGMATKELAGLARYNWLMFAFNTSDIAANLVLTAVLCVYFVKIRSSSLRRTRSFVTLLIMFTINTGLLGLMIAVCTMIMRLVFPKSILFYAEYLPYSQVYANSLLASLNARDWHWFRKDEPEIFAVPLTNLTFANAPRELPGDGIAKHGSVAQDDG